MNEEILKKATTFFPNLKKGQILKTLELLEEGNTIPFIARYRKEVTGSLDEVQIKEIQDKVNELEKLQSRKESVLKTIEEQGKLTEELKKSILTADKLQTVEDLYLPYKQKKRTKATIAKENGLEPLAKFIWKYPGDDEVMEKIQSFINPENELETEEDVRNGVHEILAEEVGENAKIREWLRNFIQKNAFMTAQIKNGEKDASKVFEMYYDFSEKLGKLQNHRVLAMNRGEKEGVLKVSLEYDVERVFAYFYSICFKYQPLNFAMSMVEKAYKDAYKRFLKPSVEKEIRNFLKEQAEASAIEVFGENLKNLLLQPTLKGKVVLGFDPAYRTGAKLAIVDALGRVLDISVIYPVKPANIKQIEEAKKEFVRLIETYKVDVIAIGNGTASRESEAFVAECLKMTKTNASFTIVNEAGASVYSASELARSEFPDLTVEKRSAISIARRLQDPLAELIKIDPKSVGVGQYQHDVNQKKLEEELDFTVEMVVNKVGVDVNTASPQLLEHISGLNKTIAGNIEKFRHEFGGFASRTGLKKVPRLGPKAYEQAIGFLRVMDGKNPLDSTRIHPEMYPAAKSLLESLGISLKDVSNVEKLKPLKTIDFESVANKLGVGVLTLKDIVDDLLTPGRDVRDQMPEVILRSDVLKMEDLKVGMKLKGTVRNVVDFGAFVDIGVKQDGLVHLSKMVKKYIEHPKEVVAIGDVVEVWVDAIDEAKSRISLSMLEKAKHKEE
ncbi:MAG: RNA-binding transcriptional accessory protein [Streptococcaceae bacterium]|jgi:uncharacterized protein|nr:RNA-binding transcriptional accessory protein [Streptococcaceae bacterium]